MKEKERNQESENTKKEERNQGRGSTKDEEGEPEERWMKGKKKAIKEVKI